MSKPDWFTLIQQWRLKDMGVYGVTLPFLVGALGHKSGESNLGTQHVHDVLNDIIERPVDGYVTEVRWCSDIDAPVFTVMPIDSMSNQMLFKSFSPRLNSEGASLGFSEDIQSMFGLDCNDSCDCYEKLVKYAAKYIEKGQYSRIRRDTGGAYEYGSFLQKDLLYIQQTIMES